MKADIILASKQQKEQQEAPKDALHNLFLT